MTNVAAVNSQQPPPWNPTADEIRRVKQAVANEAYPPAGRRGVGPVASRAS